MTAFFDLLGRNKSKKGSKIDFFSTFFFIFVIYSKSYINSQNFKKNRIKIRFACVYPWGHLIQKQSGLNLPTIHIIIHQDLNKETRKKTRVHKLTDDHKKNRKTNCRKLYEKHIAGDRSEYVFTLDEALVYEDVANEQTQWWYLDGILKLSREVWSEIDIVQIQRVFNSWKWRFRLISASDGEHKEQIKGINRRPFKA